MATSTKFANANTVVTTGWTNPTNAYSDDGVYATSAPAKNADVTTDYGFPSFSTADIPDGSLINSVTIEMQYKSSTITSSGAVIGLRGNNNGTLLTETTFAMNLTDQTVTRQYTSGISLADLRNANFFKARVRGSRANSNTAITWSLDYVKVTVDYTAPATLTVTGFSRSVVHGSATASVNVEPAGFTPRAVLGQPSVSVAIGATGFAAQSAFGSPTLSSDVTLAVSGFQVQAQFGSPSIVPRLEPSGFSPQSVMGQPVVTGNLNPAGLAVGVAFGEPTLDTGTVLQATGFTVTVQLGTPALSTNLSVPGDLVVVLGGTPEVSATLAPAGGQARPELGAPSVSPTLGPAGIAAGVLFGSPSIQPVLTLEVAGFAGQVQFGVPAVAAGIRPAGFGVRAALGETTMGVECLHNGFTVGVQFGTPYIGDTVTLEPVGFQVFVMLGQGELNAVPMRPFIPVPISRGSTGRNVGRKSKFRRRRKRR